MTITFLGNHSQPHCSEVHHSLSLEALRHQVIRLQERKATGSEILEQAMKSQMFVWIHTHGWETKGMPMKKVLKILKGEGIPTVTYHLDLWLGLEREKDMKKDDYWDIGHFFTVDKLMADWLNQNTEVKGHYLPAGVYHGEAFLEERQPMGWLHDVVFVGSRTYHPEHYFRIMLIDWLQNTYKDRFAHYGNGGICTMRGRRLNRLYANSKVVIGDTLCLNYNYPDYFSDRAFETTGRGGFCIHPFIKGMDTYFKDKEHIAYYDYENFRQLRQYIDYYIANDRDREAIRKAGHEHTKANHLYTHRWETILKTIFP